MNTITKKLSRMPYAQAMVEIYENGAICLVSYSTKVVIIDPHGWLSCTGLYSATTRRHISAFMFEYGHGADFYTAKHCYFDNAIYNIYTREFISLADGE